MVARGVPGRDCGARTTLCPPSHYNEVVRAALAFLLVLAACTAETSKQCRRVCARQGECESAAAAAGSDTAFDEGECVAACAALERDPTTAGLVTSHVECVAKAGSDSVGCPAVLECR